MGLSARNAGHSVHACDHSLCPGARAGKPHHEALQVTLRGSRARHKPCSPRRMDPSFPNYFWAALAVLAGLCVLLILALELGYRMGRSKEKSTSAESRALLQDLQVAVLA